jgi:Methyltransferase domain
MVGHGAVEEALHHLYIGAPGTSLRKEDRKKVHEIVGILSEIERAAQAAGTRPFHLVDAAAGKAYVGLLAAELIFPGRPLSVTMIERDAARAKACQDAIAKVRAPEARFTVALSEVADPGAWPDQPDLVVALHACGPASDAVIERAVGVGARQILLVPCCTSDAVAASALALDRAEALGMPRQAEVRRRFVQAFVDGERTLRLEAAGYETRVVSFVPPTVTPHHLLWRARRVGEPVRAADAAQRLARLRAG